MNVRGHRLMLGLMLCASMSFCQRIDAAGGTDFPRFTLSPGTLDADGLPVTGARLCVLHRLDACYQMPSSATPSSGDVKYTFGLAPRSERLPLLEGGSWVFFSAMFSAGGSGTLERLAVLRYEVSGGGRLVNLLPFIALTNVSERAMWADPKASRYPILVDADFIWGKDETHFSEHFYRVETWTFSPETDHYAKVFSYPTSKKYSGGDSTPIGVLAGERAEILRRLESTP